MAGIINPTTPAPTPVPAGLTTTNYKGQQVLTGSDVMDRIQQGADAYNKSTGQNLSAMEYDKQLNPTTYGARWGVQGTSAPGPIVTGAPFSPATTERIDTPSKWDISPDQTVAGQIAKIIDPNNPLMVQAKTGALEEANRRGLSNSGIAVSAGEDAMYRAAMPIATADAATYGKAAGYNVDQQNQVNVKNAEMGNTVGIANLNAANSYSQAQLSSATQRDVATMQADNAQRIATMNADSSQRIATMEAGSRQALQSMQNENTTLLNSNQQAANMFNQTIAAITNINNNPNLDAANKTSAIAQMTLMLKNQLAVLSATSSLNLNLNFAGFAGFDDKGNWVGVQATPAPTPAPTGGAATEAAGA